MVIHNMKMYCCLLHNVTQTLIAFTVHGPFMLIEVTNGRLILSQEKISYYVYEHLIAYPLA